MTTILGLQFFILPLYAECQSKDSLASEKKNIIYVLPTAVGGDLFWDLNNFWIEMGYGRLLNGKHLVDIKIGTIVYSKTTFGDLLSEISAKYSKGYNINIEYKILLKRRFYFSSNLFYQMTITTREKEFDREVHKYISDNSYSVVRNVYCVYPKIGYQFVNGKNHIFTDIGLGIGARYIHSYSINKINTNINSGYETFSMKEFDRGSKIAQKFYLQIKVGYNF